MALIARHAVPHGPSLSVPSLPRLTVRGLGILSAVAFLLLLVDALLHPRAFFDLWAMKQINCLEEKLRPQCTASLFVTDDMGLHAALEGYAFQDLHDVEHHRD